MSLPVWPAALDLNNNGDNKNEERRTDKADKEGDPETLQ